MSVPPQNCAEKTSEPALEVSATCHGASPALAFVPPTILVKFPFLIKSSLFREPEQETQVPLEALPQVSCLEGGGLQPYVSEIWKIHYFISLEPHKYVSMHSLKYELTTEETSSRRANFIMLLSLNEYWLFSHLSSGLNWFNLIYLSRVG